MSTDKEEVKGIPEDLNIIDDNTFEEESTITEIPNIETYDLPEEKQVFVENTGNDIKVIEKEDITPFQTIRLIAKQTNTEIKEPRKGCHHCYGRGYVGFDLKSKAPVPCQCIFRGRTVNEKEVQEQYDNTRINGPKLNRTQRRKLEKYFKKQLVK